MKKITLLAATAALALSANAQYVTDDAGIQAVLDKGTKTIYAWVLDGETVDEAKKAGVTVIDQMVNEETRFLYIWPNGDSFVGNETAANPVGVDFKTGGHVAFTVGTLGWSGAGFFQDPSGMDLSGINENTRFHMAYCAMTNPVPSLGIILLNSENPNQGKPAKISVGAAFNDNGTLFPTVGPVANDEWQAVDMSLGEIKKMFPDFQIPALSNFTGNYLAILGGGTTGQNIDLDAIYLYSADEAGIDMVELGRADILVSGKTINAAGAKSMVLYDLTGKAVKKVNSSVMGLNGVGAGLYIVKAGNSVAKVLVK